MPSVMITGSFDPVTLGHEDIIRRLSEMFDEVRVVAFINAEKQGFISFSSFIPLPDSRIRIQRAEAVTKACFLIRAKTVSKQEIPLSDSGLRLHRIIKTRQPLRLTTFLTDLSCVWRTGKARLTPSTNFTDESAKQ